MKEKKEFNLSHAMRGKKLQIAEDNYFYNMVYLKHGGSQWYWAGIDAFRCLSIVSKGGHVSMRFSVKQTECIKKLLLSPEKDNKLINEINRFIKDKEIINKI